MEHTGEATHGDFLESVKIDVEIPINQSTDPKSIADRGKRIKYNLVDNIKFAIQLVRFLGSVAITCLKQIILYGMILLAPVFIAAQISNLLPEGVLAADLYTYLIALGSTFFILYSLNITRHLEKIRPEVKWWLSWRPSYEYERRISSWSIGARNLHHGYLNVQYSYTEKALYVREARGAVATIIDLSFIRGVNDTHSSAWMTKRGTHGVMLTIGDDSHQSFLYIHGCYFEDEQSIKNGNATVERWTNHLKSLCTGLKVSSRSN